MIATEAALRVALGLETTITDHERAVLQQVLMDAQAAVVQHLGYDPEQKTHTEFYPFRQNLADFAVGGWDVNADHTLAVHYGDSLSRTLQIKHLPIRSINSVKVDSNGHFGTVSGSFGSGTDWTEGQDFYVEYSQANFCESGLLLASGFWPNEPGSVKITYVAGYSPDELQGRATATSVSGGVYTNSGINARNLARAVILTAVKAMNTAEMTRKQDIVGFVGGPLSSEKLGDYSYTLGAGAQALTAMLFTLPPEAEILLEDFQNFGELRL